MLNNLLLPQSYSQWDDINKRINLERPKEELAEVVKHFGEEIPKYTDRWGEVWNCPTGYHI